MRVEIDQSRHVGLDPHDKITTANAIMLARAPHLRDAGTRNHGSGVWAPKNSADAVTWHSASTSIDLHPRLERVQEPCRPRRVRTPGPRRRAWPGGHREMHVAAGT